MVKPFSPSGNEKQLTKKQSETMKTYFLRPLLIFSMLITMYITTTASTFIPDAAGGGVTGRVIDNQANAPMEYVNVALYSAIDSTMLTGTITNADGIFKMEKIPAGNYYLKITFIGFENTSSETFEIIGKGGIKNLGDIKLKETAATLGEVAIVGEKSKVEYQIDKRVINVDKELAGKGGTAVNVLENTPSIQVDPQGNVTLRGRSDYIVLINGKQSVLKGSDALKQISANSIKQVEVITNPSAKYDADGQAGIINVITKKDQLQGLSGSINLSNGFPDRNTDNILVSYRKNKVNVFAGVDFNKDVYRNQMQLNNFSYFNGDTINAVSTAEQYNNSDNLMGKLGFDYDMNEKNSLSFSGAYGKKGFDQGTDSKLKYSINPSGESYYNVSANHMDVSGDVLEFTADYNHKFADNHTLALSGYYFSWDGWDDNRLSVDLTDENYNKVSSFSGNHYTKDNYNYQTRWNLDYKKAFTKGTLEAGMQYRYEYRFEDLNFENLDAQTGNWTADTVFSTRLDYYNNIYSGYATWSGKLIGVEYMAGVRGEYFQRSIKFSRYAGSFDYNKFMVYPSLHLSKTINNAHQFQLSYSRRINRPQPYVLNFTPVYIDPDNQFIGSPYLKPEFTDAFELNYRWMYKIMTLSAQTYYRITTNSLSTSRKMNDEGIIIHQLINADNQTSYGIEGGLDFNLAKWWQLSTGVNFYHYNIEANEVAENFSREAYSWDARWINSFNVPKTGTRFQTVLYVRGKGIDAQGESGSFYVVNLSAGQSLMKGKLNLGLSVQDLCHSIKFHYTVDSEGFNNDYYINVKGPVVMGTLSYTFNNFRDKQRGRADDINFKGGGAF